MNRPSITEAVGWSKPPQYISRDCDSRMATLSFDGSERWGHGSIRRRWLDHVLVFGDRHLRHLSARTSNEVRSHLSLKKDTPMPLEARRMRCVLALPIFGGLFTGMSDGDTFENEPPSQP
jgi:hypothetical protein